MEDEIPISKDADISSELLGDTTMIITIIINTKRETPIIELIIIVFFFLLTNYIAQNIILQNRRDREVTRWHRNMSSYY